MAISLNVPYLNQLNDTPDYFDGRGACGPTSAVMVLAGYNLLDPRPEGFGWYVCNQYTGRQGYTFSATEPVWPKNTAKAAGAYGFCVSDGEAVGSYIAQYITKNGLNANSVNASANDAKAQLTAGKPVILGTTIQGYGHVIVLRGLTDDGRFVTNDPIRPPAGKIYSWADFGFTPYMVVFDRPIGAGSTAAVAPSVPMNYKVKITQDGTNVRTGPGTQFAVVTTLKADPNRTYQITAESHGTAVPSDKQPSGVDDTWCFIPELGGYVSRTLTQVVQ